MIFASKAPDDPEEKKAWAHSMLRVQVAMWVDESALCAECKRPYRSVDDFLQRDPRAGDGYADDPDDRFIDDACWNAYRRRKDGVQS